MSKIKWLTVGGIILFVLSVVFIFVGVFVPNFFSQEYNESNTVEYSATVSRIEEEQSEYKIFMNEYTACLLVEKDQLISPNLLLEIGKNDTIVFRVISEDIVDSQYIENIFVVALKTVNTEFITLESSTVLLQKEIMNARILCIIVATLAFVGTVIMLSLAIRNGKQNKKQDI